jgi:hypothetical protein
VENNSCTSTCPEGTKKEELLCKKEEEEDICNSLIPSTSDTFGCGTDCYEYIV